MEPQVTERDCALLLMSQESLLTLGAVLGWQARAGRIEPALEDVAVADVLPA